MEISNPSALMSVLQGATSTLRSLCLDRTGAIHLLTSGAQSLKFYRPPLCPVDVIEDVDLNPIGAAIYQRTISEDALLSVLDVVLQNVNGRKGQAEASRTALGALVPGLGLTVPAGLSPLAELTQVAYLHSLAGHPFHATNSTVRLETPRISLEIGRQSLSVNGEYRRTRTPLGFDPKALLARHMNPASSGGGKLSSLYRYLMQVVPEHAVALNTLFSAALHGGYDCRDVLLKGFDLEHVSKVKVSTESTPWLKAINLLTGANYMPYGKIRAKLEPLIGAEDFESIFGQSRDWFNRIYGEDTAARHRVSVLGLHHKFLQKTQAEPVSSASSDVQDAIELQRMIR